MNEDLILPITLEQISERPGLVWTAAALMRPNHQDKERCSEEILQFKVVKVIMALKKVLTKIWLDSKNHSLLSDIELYIHINIIKF